MLSSTLALGFVLVFALAAFTWTATKRVEAAFPPRGKLVPVESGVVHVTQNLPVGPPRAVVALIHGASGSEADMMAPLGAALAGRGFRVLSIDRPGHGWSDRLGAEDAAAQATAIRAALAALDAPLAIIVAHSLAGVVATNLALDHAEAVSGLVLVAPVTHPWPGGAVSWYYGLATTPVVGDVFTHLLAMPIGSLLIDRTVAAIFAPNEPPPDYAMRIGAGRVLRPANFAANARDVAGTFEFVTKQAPRLGQIRAPTAIVTGDSDAIVYTHIHSYGSARDITGATLTVLPGVGHSPHWVAPEAVVKAVEDVAARARS